MNELSISDTLGTACGIDPYDPKLAELSFAFPAVNIGIRFRTIDSILSVSEKTGFITKVSSRFLKDFFTAFAGSGYIACSRHDEIS